MSVDIEKLEALAKAAPTGPWYGPDELAHKGTVFDCDLGSLLSYESIESERDACVAYVAAANPVALLELIAYSKKQAQQFKEWQASHHANYVAAAEERDDLRAEVAGLKTGYEAYERVNAELRAECERLKRNRDMWKGQVERQSEMLRLAHEADKQLKAECEALKEKHEAARDRKNSITALQIENESLRDAAAVSAMRIKELDLLFGRYILAMRAAVIEDEHGKTETAGMDWIFNSLLGPGQLPPEGETDAQAYFDREIVAVDNGMQEVLAFHDQRRAAKSKEASQ